MLRAPAGVSGAGVRVLVPDHREGVRLETPGVDFPRGEPVELVRLHLQERAAAEDPTLPVETAAAHLPRPGRIGAVRIVPRHP